MIYEEMIFLKPCIIWQKNLILKHQKRQYKSLYDIKSTIPLLPKCHVFFEWLVIFKTGLIPVFLKQGVVTHLFVASFLHYVLLFLFFQIPYILAYKSTHI
jgi:hypothetical protein